LGLVIFSPYPELVDRQAQLDPLIATVISLSSMAGALARKALFINILALAGISAVLCAGPVASSVAEESDAVAVKVDSKAVLMAIILNLFATVMAALPTRGRERLFACLHLAVS